MYAPDNILKALEYPQVLARLSLGCRTRAGADTLSAFRPLDDGAVASERRARSRLLESLSASQGIPPVPETGDDLLRIENCAQQGVALTGSELADLAATLSGVEDLRRYLSSREAGDAECLTHWRKRLDDQAELRHLLARTVSVRGEVLDTASDALASVRRRLRDLRSDLQSFYRRILTDGAYQDAFQDRVVTERDGRMVVPVKRERQSQVPGLMHGLSASGSTVFVEPSEAVEPNNRLREAVFLEEAEVQRALREVTLRILERRVSVEDTFAACAEVDAHQAVAAFAGSFDAVYVEPRDGDPLRLVGARHPILCLQEGPAFREKVVPLDLDYGKAGRVVLVSGPNAGGKTASLKTLGLACLMAQAGLPCVVHVETTLPTFRRFDSDLSDEQDLEHHLSTYAAKLTALRRMIESAGSDTLLLLDELGSGTDPREGGALGLAVLERLTAQGTHVFATTHQPELKRLTEDRPGMQNAGMVFDDASGKPTYRLVQGVPGRSHALSLAAQVGFPQDVLDRAKSLIPSDELDLSELLEKAAREKVAAETARVEAERLRDEVARHEAVLREERGRLRAEAKQIRDEARQEAAGMVKNTRRQVEHWVQGLERVPQGGLFDPTKAKETRRALNDKLKNLTLPPAKRPVTSVILAPGDDVVLKSSGMRGRVESCDEDRETAAVRLEGGLKVTCVYADLETAPERSEARKPVEVRGPSSDGSGRLEVDVRGCRADEAITIVDQFLDEAVVTGQPFARIIHGKGTGKLREALHEHLKKHPAGYDFRLGEWGEGDYGVTVVEFK